MREMTAVDLAYQIIELHEENAHLRRELEHYKALYEMHRDDMENSIQHSKQLIGTMLAAVIDPNSVINKGHAAIIKEQAGASNA